MVRLLGALLIIGLFMVAVKVALALIILAGLIFRTKETIGVLTGLFILGLLSRFPMIGFGLLVLFVAFGIYHHVNKPEEEPEALPAPEGERAEEEVS